MRDLEGIFENTGPLAEHATAAKASGSTAINVEEVPALLKACGIEAVNEKGWIESL